MRGLLCLGSLVNVLSIRQLPLQATLTMFLAKRLISNAAHISQLDDSKEKNIGRIEETMGTYQGNKGADM